MAERQKKITLYFTAGSELTDHDVEVMDTLPNPRHRNAAYIESGDKLEPCDFVAGPAVPDSYSEIPNPPGYDSAEEAGIDGEPENMSTIALKKALDERGVAYKQNASKAKLVLLLTEAQK